MILTGLFSLTGSLKATDPSKWSDKKIEKWFSKNEWLAGWNRLPDASINKREFAVSYFKNKDRWDKAFDFLRKTDLSKLEVKRYDIDGDNLYASVSEYLTKNEETTDFEAHRKYIDIQCVISGKEIMNVTPLNDIKEVIIKYDDKKDIEFVTVDKMEKHLATPDRFFVFFPTDVHRPGIKDGANATVRKVVIKLKVD